MTERCQKKFTEKKYNKNYIIFTGILVGFCAVLYFYSCFRFHLIIITVSYVLGCVACYYGLHLNIFQTFLEQISCHFIRKLPSNNEYNAPVRNCNACGSANCSRHDPTMSPEPWTGLFIHKQLDQAIEDFYNKILEQFINTWYSKITLQPFFVDELRQQLRYASACLIRRALTIDFGSFITSRLVPCALRHATGPRAPHPAATTRANEQRYVRCVADALLPHLQRCSDRQNEVFRILIREIFAGWVLLSLTDVLADPQIVNTLIVLATGDETLAALPDTPNYKVEFLENFVRQSESQYSGRARLLRLDVEMLLLEPGSLYALLQHLRAVPQLKLLQFYQDIKSFQTRILKPELSEAEQFSLHREALELFSRYRDDVPGVTVPDDLLGELDQLLQAGPDAVKRLQTSRALYQAARQSHAALEKIMLPKFLHSEEFYKLFIGPRLPTGYQKQMSKRPGEKLSLLKLGMRIKNVLKQTIDGQVLEKQTMDGQLLEKQTIDGQMLEKQIADGQVLDSISSELVEGEGMENIDILDLDCLAEDSMDQDLRTYKVVLTNVESTLQAPPRRGSVRVFTLAVHRIGGIDVGVAAGVGVSVDVGVGAALWRVKRSEHDFHLLRAKLREFHGDALALQPLPSRRDNSPLETLRYKYEDFIQRLLQISLLQTSELLHLFLTVEGDFSLVVQASTLNVSNTDLGNIYQSVAHKLRKEKGQHLESFLRNFLVSTDKERFQALKQGTHIEEAQEVNEEDAVRVPKRLRSVRNIHSSVFGNNLDLESELIHADTWHQTCVVGFTQCLMFLLIKVMKLNAFVTGIVGSLLSLVRGVADLVFNALLNKYLCEVLSERRLAHLVRLGHGVLFPSRTLPRRRPPTPPAARTALVSAAGPLPPLATAAGDAFDLLQSPANNKQLVYNLLDLCVLELFPELRNTELMETKS